MQHSSETVVSPFRRQAIDALLQARELPVGRDRNELRQLAMGLRGLAALQETEDWQSRIALTGGFVQPHQPPSRRGTVANHHAADVLAQRRLDSGRQIYGLLARGLKSLVGYEGITDFARRH
jgi:hypothetical protein